MDLTFRYLIWSRPGGIFGTVDFVVELNWQASALNRVLSDALGCGAAGSLDQGEIEIVRRKFQHITVVGRRPGYIRLRR